MHRFWELALRPCLDAVDAGSVAEIGAARGDGTRLLVDYCAESGATLHVIDPKPRLGPAALERPGAEVVLHRDLSLNVLPSLGAVDVAFVDGDHNWYTVLGELRLLAEGSRREGVPPPVILCHDVCWPYGRRDMYYDPDTVPEGSRQPWARAGIEPGREGLAEDGGLNSSYCNAVSEGGPRNGVLTAIEDFLAESGEEISLTILPVMYGLGILVPARRMAAHPELGAVLDRWPHAEGWEELVRLAEEQRILAAIERQAAIRRERDRDDERVSPAP